MSVLKMLRISLVVCLVGGSGAAFAMGAPPAQTHHCKMADGTMDAKKTHKQCSAAKGTWTKDAAPAAVAPPAAASPPAATPPPAPAPAK